MQIRSVERACGLTSPAPRNKNVWSDKVPPTNFRDAMSPAKTTDAVPCVGENYIV